MTKRRSSIGTILHERVLAYCVMAACVSAWAAAGSVAADPEASRFEEEIRAFERQDREHPPAPGGILFVGSSSIRLWNLDESFPDKQALNRGFGGSQFSDVLHFADRIIVPCRPHVIVLYAGDNDLAEGKTPRQVAADCGALIDKLRDSLPDARLLVLSVKPSPARWQLIEQQRETNRLIEELAEQDKRVEFVDLASPLLGDDGKPRAELFEADQLHLNEEGYRVWTKAFAPVLTPEPPPDVGTRRVTP